MNTRPDIEIQNIGSIESIESKQYYNTNTWVNSFTFTLAQTETRWCMSSEQSSIRGTGVTCGWVTFVIQYVLCVSEWQWEMSNKCVGCSYINAFNILGKEDNPFKFQKIIDPIKSKDWVFQSFSLEINPYEFTNSLNTKYQFSIVNNFFKPKKSKLHIEWKRI